MSFWLRPLECQEHRCEPPRGLRRKDFYKYLSKGLRQDPPLNRSCSTRHSQPCTAAVCQHQGWAHGIDYPACSLRRHLYIWILFYMVGNFKEICPNFITLIFSIPDISRGNEENLRKQAQGRASVAPFSLGRRQGHEFQMDSVLHRCLSAGAPGRKAGGGCCSCPWGFVNDILWMIWESGFTYITGHNTTFLKVLSCAVKKLRLAGG